MSFNNRDNLSDFLSSSEDIFKNEIISHWGKDRLAVLTTMRSLNQDWRKYVDNLILTDIGKMLKDYLREEAKISRDEKDRKDANVARYNLTKNFLVKNKEYLPLLWNINQKQLPYFEIENIKNDDKVKVILSNCSAVLKNEFSRFLNNPEKDIITNVLKPYLRFSNLSGINMHENANLSGFNLQDVNLQNSNFSEVYFSNSNLSRCNMENAVLQYAHFSDVILRDANIRNADLSHANLASADLTNVDFSNANLSNALLTVDQLSNTKSIIGAKIIFIADSELLLEAERPYTRLHSDVKPIKDILIKQYKKLIEEENNIDKLNDIFFISGSDEVLTIKRPWVGDELTQGKFGETASSKEVMQEAITKLTAIVNNMETKLDEDTATKLLKTAEIFDQSTKGSGFFANFYSTSPLQQALMKNQSLSVLPGKGRPG